MTLTEYRKQEQVKKLPMATVEVQDDECEIIERHTNAMQETYYSVFVKGFPFEYKMSRALCENGMLYTTDDDGNPKRPTVFFYVGSKVKLIER